MLTLFISFAFVGFYYAVFSTESYWALPLIVLTQYIALKKGAE